MKYITNTKYEDIPRGVVEPTKKYILVTLGAIVAGSSEKEVTKLVYQIKQYSKSYLLVGN